MPKRLAPALAALLILFLVACGTSGEGADGGANSPPQGPTTAAGSGDGKVATMVMPLRFFGGDYRHFEVDGASGYLDSAEMAQESILPADTAAEIDARGFRSGYELAFEDGKIHRLGLNGIYSVGSEVDVFSDANAASAFMAKELADIQTVVGQDIGGGVILTDVTTFEVTELGDEAIGAHASLVVNGLSLHSTAVWLRLGNYLASAELASTYKGGVAEEEATTGWAHILQGRILGVESGAIDEGPVSIPTLPPTDTSVPVVTAAP